MSAFALLVCADLNRGSVRISDNQTTLVAAICTRRAWRPGSPARCESGVPRMRALDILRRQRADRHARDARKEASELGWQQGRAFRQPVFHRKPHYEAHDNG